MYRRIAIAFLLSISMIALFSEEYFIDYLEGDVYDAGRDRYLDIGDPINDDTRLELSPDACVEIQDGSRRIIINKEGVYNMREILNSPAPKVQNSASLIMNKFKGLVRDTDIREQSAVGGVRADKADTGASFDMFVDEADPEALLQEGIENIENGDFEYALYTFDEAYCYADEWMLDILAFYLGYTYYMTGDLENAAVYVFLVNADENDDFYPDYMLLLIQVLLDQGAYQEALNAIETFEEYFKGTVPPILRLYEGISTWGTGRISDSREIFQALIDSSPGTEETRQAENFLRDLEF